MIRTSELDTFDVRGEIKGISRQELARMGVYIQLGLRSQEGLVIYSNDTLPADDMSWRMSVKPDLRLLKQSSRVVLLVQVANKGDRPITFTQRAVTLTKER